MKKQGWYDTQIFDPLTCAILFLLVGIALATSGYPGLEGVGVVLVLTFCPAIIGLVAGRFWRD